MLKNDFQIDIKRLYKAEKMTNAKVGEKLGVTGQSISARYRGAVMNEGYIEICDALGYDIEVRYIKR